MYGIKTLDCNSKQKEHNMTILENDLVPVYETSTGEKVVYGSELHLALGVRTPYKDWSVRRLKDCDALENEDFEAAQICAPSGQTKKDHIIKLDTAKEMAMLERNEKGKQVRRYFIRIEEKYKEQRKPRSSAEMLLMYAQQFYEQEQRIFAVEHNMKELEARVTTHNEDYYTVAGYASLRGVSVDVNRASMLGRKASSISKEYGYEIGKIKDPRFGTVNTYHVDILKEVFGNI